MRFSRRVTAPPGRAISTLLTLIGGVISGPAMAWADHPAPLRSEGWSPLTAALVFGGLALLAGMLVIVIVTLLTRRDGRSS